MKPTNPLTTNHDKGPPSHYCRYVLSQDLLQPSLSYEASYETSFALVLFDSPHSESKVKQN